MIFFPRPSKFPDAYEKEHQTHCGENRPWPPFFGDTVEDRIDPFTDTLHRCGPIISPVSMRTLAHSCRALSTRLGHSASSSRFCAYERCSKKSLQSLAISGPSMSRPSGVFTLHSMH